MKILNKTLIYILLIFTGVIVLSSNSFARGNNEIEVYKMGNNSITIKWTPYEAGEQILEKYQIGYRVYGETEFNTIDVDASLLSSDYNMTNGEFIKKISGLQVGTVYDITLDVYIEGMPVPSAYNSIMTMTKMIIDKSTEVFNNPYGIDDVGHVDFAFTSPKQVDLGALVSVEQSYIKGYDLVVSDSQGEIYSSGAPYKILYDDISGNYKIFRVTSIDDPLTYNDIQFEFAPQIKDGFDFLTFSLYKSNQPSTDNFQFARYYYVVVKPIFAEGSPLEDVIVNATSNYETIENIATLLPLSVTQIAEDLVKVEFPKVGTGSMSYDIYRGRLLNSLTKIHTQYDNGSFANILYYNKLTDVQDGDVYYYRVEVAGGNIKSKIIPITVSINPNIAPVIKNLQIEDIIIDKSNNNADIIVSWDKPLNEDVHRNNLKYRLYLNTDRTDQVFDNDVVYDTFGNKTFGVDGKIILNTKKDINNNNILFEGQPVVFERIVEISAEDLVGVGSEYSGSNPVGNFLSTGNNYYRVLRNGEQVTRTLYRINGSNFLDNPDVPQVLGEPHVIYVSNLEGELATDYKNDIKLNNTYFIKMDSFNSMIAKTSDYSITTSFTTPKDIVDIVAIPDNFEVELIEENRIGLVWDILSSGTYNDADVTYEIFISENGSYDNADFQMLNNPNITTSVSRKHLLIDVDYELEDLIPKQIQSNSTYLFKIRTRWNTKDDKGNDITLYSTLSSIVPVTTKRPELEEPDVNSPLAPTDFEVTEITSTVASFIWSEVDENSTYRIVRTSEMIEPFAPLSETGQGVTNGFVNNNGIYTYSDALLNANTLYYFSIRSESIDDGQTLTSPWITLPVTTILVEQPTDLILIERHENGHMITIGWKGEKNLDYEIVKKDEASRNYILAHTVTGTQNEYGDKTFETVVGELESNTQYLIKVRAKDSETNMYSKYCDPILVRTEFNQDDYEKELEKEEEKKVISDVAKEWQNKAVAEIGNNDERIEIWIKEEKSTEEVKNLPGTNYIIDLSADVKDKAVHIPLDLVYQLEESQKMLQIKISDGNIYIKPNFLDYNRLSNRLDYDYVENKIVYLEINQVDKKEVESLVPSGDYIASEMNNISLKLIGYDKTIEELNDSITESIDNIVNVYERLINRLDKDKLEEIVDESIKDSVKRVINRERVVETPIPFQNGKEIVIEQNFTLDKRGETDRYVAYIKNGFVSKEIQGRIIDTGKIQFEVDSFGKIVIIGKKNMIDIGNSSFEHDIRDLTLRYDFSNQIDKGQFRPNKYATKEDTLEFLVNTLYPAQNNHLTLIEKSQQIGIIEGFPIWDLESSITKEELAYLLSNAYQVETGIDLNAMKASEIELYDIDEINPRYRDRILKVIELDIISYSDNIFEPTRKITRAELASIILNFLKNIERY